LIVVGELFYSGDLIQNGSVESKFPQTPENLLLSITWHIR